MYFLRCPSGVVLSCCLAQLLMFLFPSLCVPHVLCTICHCDCVSVSLVPSGVRPVPARPLKPADVGVKRHRDPTAVVDSDEEEKEEEEGVALGSASDSGDEY